MITTFRFPKIAMLAAPLALVAGIASAGGLAPPVETPAPTPLAPVPVMRSADWSGFYFGAQLGYGEITAPLLSDSDAELNGAIYGVHAS